MDCPRCGVPSAPTARFCAQCGAPLAEAPVSEGERRHATVMFSDLSGYTALNERLDPEEVEEIMGRVKRDAAAIIEAHGGVVNQFIGDEIMALFGVPTARRDDAVRAVRAALELHRAVRDLSMDVGPRIGRALTMHTGINSGLVIVRRSDARAGEYLVTGDTVNTGARLLKLALEDQVIVGQDTWRAIEHVFDAEPGAPTEVKGKERPVIPWRIQGERATAPKPARPMFGRSAEVARFEIRARACVEGGRGGVLLLRGDPGIGKTRLAAEFFARAAGLGMEAHRALVLDFSPERGRDAIRTLARALAGTAAPAAGLAPETEIFLAELLDRPLRAELGALAAAIDPETRDRGTRRVLRDLASSAASTKPRLLLVEDLHWADDWTIRHLEALGEAAAQAAVLVLLTTRRENDPGARFSADAQAEPMDLGPLGEDDALGLAAQFAIPVESARTYVSRAEGNPLFLEQLLMNAGEAALHNLPGSIQGLVLARMDRLPAPDRAALQAASVLGQRFSLDALRWMLDAPQQDCRTLLEHFLVKPEGEAFLFWHALIRDGAYESLLKSRRRRLHARAAEWFRDRDPSLAAEHYDRAGDPRASAAYLAACQQEASRYRYDLALGLAERGLALATEPADRLALLAAKAGVQLESGRAREAIASWKEALGISQDAASRCRALIGVAAGMRIVDRAAEGLEALAEAEPLARAGGLALERSRLHHLRGNLYFGLGRREDCVREHEAALACAREAGSREAEANALGGLGDAYYIRGRMRSAYEQFGRCVDLAHEERLGRIEVANMHMRGWTAHYLLRLGEALDVGARSLEMALAVSHRRVETVARALNAYVGGWLIGELGPAQQHLDIALARARELGARRFESQLLTYDAQLALRRGDRSRALQGARDTVAHCRAHGMEFFGPVALGLLGRLSEDGSERASCNAEALALLDGGTISHNYFEFYAMAIEGALERGAWDEAELYCGRLAAFTAEERLALADFIVERGRALAATGRGADVGTALDTLTKRAGEARLNVFLPALALARGRIARSS